MTEIARLTAYIDADTSAFERGISAANRQFSDLASGLQRQAGGIQSALNGVFQGIGVGVGLGAFNAISQGIQGAATELIGFSSELQRAGYAFTAFAGGGERGTAIAANFLDQLKELAATTPFTFEQIAKGAQRFVGMGVEMERVIPIMKDISVVAQAMGASSAQIDRINLAVSQVVARGKLQMQEVNQLANEGVQAIKILADASGKTPAAIIDAMEKGKISANEFLNALDKYAHDPRLQSMAEAVNHSFDTATSNITDRLQQLGATAIAPFFNGLTDMANGLASALNTDAVKQFAADIAATFSDLGNRLGPLKQAFADAFAQLSSGDISGAIGTALKGIGDTVAGFAQSLFGGGYNLIAALAGGIMSGANDLITAAADYVASIIASFLVGSSPPAEGPLSKIDEAGRTLIETYVGGMGGGVAKMADVAQGITDEVDGINASLKLTDGNAGLQAAAGNLGALKSAGEGVTATIATINAALHDVEQASRDLKFTADDIKNSYDDQISALQDQYDAVTKVNDALQQQQDIADKLAGLDIQKRSEQAKGDPVAHAELANKLQLNRFAQDDINNQIRALELDNKKGQNDKRIADLRGRQVQLQREELSLKQADAALIDRTASAQATKDKAAFDAAQSMKRINQDQADLQRKLTGQPILDQIKAKQEEEKKALKPLEDQLRIYDRQRAVLQGEKQDWDDIAAKIRVAMAPLQDAKAAAGAAGSAAAKGAGAAPKGGVPTAVPLTIPKQAIPDVTEAGKNMGQSLINGMQAKLVEVGPQILGGAIGLVVGGIAFGPIGALIGGPLGAAIAKDLHDKFPNLGELLRDKLTIATDAVSTFFQALKGNWRPDGVDESGNVVWIDPFVKEVGKIGLALKDDIPLAAKKIQTAFDDLSSTATTVWAGIASDSENAWSRIQPVLQGQVDKLKTFGTEVQPDFEKAMQNIQKINETIHKLMAGTTQEQLDIQKASWTGHEADVQTGWAAFATQIGTNNQTFLDQVGLATKTALALLAGNWQGAFDLITKARDTWQAGEDAKWASWGDAWSKFWAQKGTDWGTFWDSIFTKAQTIAGSIKSLFDPGGPFATAILGAGQIGKDVVAGIQSGVDSALGGFKDWITTNLANALPQWVRDVLGIKSPSTVFMEIGRQLIAGLESGMFERVKSLDVGTLVGRLMTEFQAAGSDGAVSSWLAAALAITGTDMGWLPGLQKLVSIESGGNPSAVNPIEVLGQHATGLLQMLPSTFQAHMLDGFGDIFNPLDNAISAIRYIKSTYGTVYDIPHTSDGNYLGYRTGGVVPYDQVAQVHAGEVILRADQARAIGAQIGGRDPSLSIGELHIHGDVSAEKAASIGGDLFRGWAQAARYGGA